MKTIKTLSKPEPQGEYSFRNEHTEKLFRSVIMRLPKSAYDAIAKRLALVTDSVDEALAAGGAIDKYACVKSTVGGDVIFIHPSNLIGQSESYIEAAIAHELAHVFLAHAAKGMATIQEEDEVDDLCATWGFRRLVTEAQQQHANRIVFHNPYIN